MSFESSADSNLLLIYDETDKYLNTGDVENILKYWQDAQTHIVRDIGHEGLIKNQNIAQEIMDFID